MATCSSSVSNNHSASTSQLLPLAVRLIDMGRARSCWCQGDDGESEKKNMCKMDIEEDGDEDEEEQQLKALALLYDIGGGNGGGDGDGDGGGGHQRGSIATATAAAAKDSTNTNSPAISVRYRGGSIGAASTLKCDGNDEVQLGLPWSYQVSVEALFLF